MSAPHPLQRKAFTQNPIDTAPKDGTLVIVGDPDCGEFPMKWDNDSGNPLVQDGDGIWVMCDGSMTWSEEGGYGPTYWRHLTDEENQTKAH